MSAPTVHKGFYLSGKTTTKVQTRGRRAEVRSVTVVHTAESKAAALAVANFIATRTTYGSYHTLCDPANVVRLIPVAKAAFGDGTGSNEWATHLSACTFADSWGEDPEFDSLLIDALVAGQLDIDDQLDAMGKEPPRAEQITRVESNEWDASGFISHGARDPKRRSDPGDGFPWDEFFRRLTAARKGIAPLVAEDQSVRDLQVRLNQLFGLELAEDNILGPKTAAAVSTGSTVAADTALALRHEVRAVLDAIMLVRAVGRSTLSVEADLDVAAEHVKETVLALGL